MNKHLLLVEDDPNLGLVLQEYLQLKGQYKVQLCVDGEEGLESFKRQTFDLCILDVMMPKKDGFTLAADIRKLNPLVPIIFATAKGMMEDKIEGFQLGADDYITKPFRIEELLMRIQAVLKRSEMSVDFQSQQQFAIGQYAFDYNSQSLLFQGTVQRLSNKEAELLYLLCLHKNDVLKREDALLKIWQDDSYFNGRSMDVYMSKLRKFLREDPDVEILNLHGKGFKLICK